jgi:hypothetical protein
VTLCSSVRTSAMPRPCRRPHFAKKKISRPAATRAARREAVSERQKRAPAGASAKRRPSTTVGGRDAGPSATRDRLRGPPQGSVSIATPQAGRETECPRREGSVFLARRIVTEWPRPALEIDEIKRRLAPLMAGYSIASPVFNAALERSFIGCGR